MLLSKKLRDKRYWLKSRLISSFSLKELITQNNRISISVKPPKALQEVQELAHLNKHPRRKPRKVKTT